MQIQRSVVSRDTFCSLSGSGQLSTEHAVLPIVAQAAVAAQWRGGHAHHVRAPGCCAAPAA
eukprot:6207616-Pleurochrysis_carterae.AAC.2